MADPAMLSLDDYIKSQKKTGKMSFGGRGGRRGPKPGGSGANRGGGRGNPGGNRTNFQGRKGQGRQGNNNNNVQQRRGNRGVGGNRRRGGGGRGANQPRGNFQRFGGGGAQVQIQGGGGQGQNRRLKMRNRNPRNNPSLPRRNSGGRRQPQQQRYFNSPAALLQATPKGRRGMGQGKRLRLRQRNVVAPLMGIPLVGARATAAVTKRAMMKLAKKRVQRAKLSLGKKKVLVGIGKPKKLMTAAVGRVALGRNGFFTVRNTQAKQVERSLVKMKIARAQQARTKTGSPQHQRSVNMPGSSRQASRSVRATNASARPLDWNTPIVRTMRNDLMDEMTTPTLNPEIQRKIAFIQSRSNRDRAPVMQDFKAPVTTSRMKLSDRFRLMRD